MANDVVQYQLTPPAHPVIWVWATKPAPFNPKTGAAPAYKATWLLDPASADAQAINRIQGELAMAAFGTYDNVQFAMRSGDQMIAEALQRNPGSKPMEFLRGKYVLQTHSAEKRRDGTLGNPPRLIVWNKLTGKYERHSEPHERQLVADKFYSGVLAVGSIGLKAWTGNGRGVTAYLNEITSFGVGDKIITGVDDNERLGDATKYVGHVGTASQINPMAGPIGVHPTAAPPVGGPLAGMV